MRIGQVRVQQLVCSDMSNIESVHERDKNATVRTHLSPHPHSPFILAHDTSRGILQPVIARINALLVNTV